MLKSEFLEVILSTSVSDGSQDGSRGSYYAFLGPAGKIALRMFLEACFDHWALVAVWVEGSGFIFGVDAAVYFLRAGCRCLPTCL